MTVSWKPQVYLVGAGPGDPGLLTRRGETLLQRADIVFHDALIDARLLDLIPGSTERVAVGKRAGGIGPKQVSINDRMIEAAKAGRVVVRLKGGDPFIFGRGGEEMLSLAEAGIRFEIVPGVSSASAVPAMIGIPLTLRGISSVVHIVTGHVDPADTEGPVNWDLFTQPGHTVVVLMGSAHLIEILKRLKASGMETSTPLALIHWGTFANQRSLRGTVGEALEHPDRFTLPSPTLAVIGGVAGLEEALNWFERRPLFGRRVLLTRPRGHEDEMLEALREAGADAMNIPLIHFDSSARDHDEVFLERLEEIRLFDGWLILPSPAAIGFLGELLERLELDARALAGIRIAVLSPKAADQLGRLGLRPDFIPERADGESLAATLPLADDHAAAVVAGSSLSRVELREALERRGVRTAHHVLYATTPDPEGVSRIREAIVSEAVDDLIFTSPSGITAVMEGATSEVKKRLAGIRCWTIGKTTAKALREQGFEPAGIAGRPSAEGLLETLVEALHPQKNHPGLTDVSVAGRP